MAGGGFSAIIKIKKKTVVSKMISRNEEAKIIPKLSMILSA
jgi:hypothetical protein